jgi:Flp pilus assembly protein TadG
MSGPGACRSKPDRCGSLQRTCRGAVAVEFALVFLLFFALFYAIVAYGFVMTLRQNLTLAAEEGARAAVQDAPDEAARLARAQTTANGVLSWLPGDGITVSATAANCVANPATRCVTVTVGYDYAAHPIVPALPLLGIAIPANLGASATVQI